MKARSEQRVEPAESMDLEALWMVQLEGIRKLLPLQNPLQSFLHNNILMAWEDQEFWHGVGKASRLYGAEVPRPSAFYHAEYQRGRISDLGLNQALLDVLQGEDDWITQSSELSDVATWIRTLFLLNEETPCQGLLKILGPDALVNPKEGWLLLCPEPPETPPSAVLPSDVAEWFCSLCETFLDQGLSTWGHSHGRSGLLEFAREWAQHTKYFNLPWQKDFAAILRDSNGSARSLIVSEWQSSGKSPEQWQDDCLRLLFCIKGWSGMLNKSEVEAYTMPFLKPSGRLEDLLFLLLTVKDLCPSHEPRLQKTRGRFLYLSPQALRASFEKIWSRRHPIDSEPAFAKYLQILSRFDQRQTQIVWQQAYENSLHNMVVGLLEGQRDRQASASKGSEEVRVEMLFCMDDREESLRRHVERTLPYVKTEGVLGHFGLDMWFKAHDGARLSQQCPPVIKPRRVMIEESKEQSSQRSRTWAQRFSAIHLPVSSSLLRGTGSALGLGSFYLLPLGAKVFAPLWLQKSKLPWLARSRGGKVLLEKRIDPKWGVCGYTLEEQADIVLSILAAVKPKARLVIILGHESTSTNNPYQQAYGCGACSGNSGAPNARIFTQMANDLEVREILKRRGFMLSDQTHFLAAVHDTTRDVIRYFPDERVKKDMALKELWDTLAKDMEKALHKNAEERSRLLVMGPKPKSIRRHMQSRALNLSELRPEYGHSRCCLAIFGRRDLTQSLVLDRRSFLVSYDPDNDHDGSILRPLLHGAMPVVANITLDYFFSSLDSHAFGAGSKLPLNSSALLGMITGSRGDLRIGLTEQMVEIHEPVRALVLVEVDKKRLQLLVEEHPRLKRLLSNAWIRLGAIDPQSGELAFWAGGSWKKAGHSSDSPQDLLDAKWQPRGLSKPADTRCTP